MPVVSTPQPSKVASQPEGALIPPVSDAVSLDPATTNAVATEQPKLDFPLDKSSTLLGSDPRSTKRKRWPIVVAAGAVGIIIAGGLVAVSSGESTSDQAAPITLTAVSAEQRDLIEFTSLDGRLVYADVVVVTGASADGSSQTNSASADGSGADASSGTSTSSSSVVTAVVADGDEVVRGTVLYEVNAAPISIFYGDIPLYRELAEGTVGDDVLILEQNLASLGYNTFDDDEGNQVATSFLVDGVFDAATTEAVIRWQEDVGLAPSGSVVPTDVVVISGPAIVTELDIDVGSTLNQGTPVMSLNTIGDVEAVYIQHSGEIELFVASGDVLVSGDIVYTVNELPITAVVADAEFNRELADGVDDGEDVLAIEEMLVALGYDADGDVVVDEEFDEFTTQAITEWKEDLQNTFEGVVVNGAISLDEIMLFEPGVTVGTITEHDTDVLASGTELWSNSTVSDTRIVETSIAVADQDALAEGSLVDIEFPDGEIVQGTVTEVATSSTVDPTNPDADPELAVEITVSTVPASAEGLNEVDVEVKLVEEIAVDATVVPVSALVATGDGGFAVEALTSDGGTQLVAVDPGMFSDGWVEVSGIQPGTQVVIPS